MNKDSLGDRMKNQYENRTRYFVPRRTYTLIRVDGKAFHSLTRNCDKPFDDKFAAAMEYTAKTMLQEIEGAQLAYTQSDEISLLLTDFATNQTQAWFNGNLQKMCSVSAGIATAAFNTEYYDRDSMGVFDSRVWTIPDPVEVANYFIWRQNDATRNAISMAAQAQFSHKSLQRLSSDQLQEKLFSEAGINFNDYPIRHKRGAAVYKEKQMRELGGLEGGSCRGGPQFVERTVAVVDKEIPIFSQSNFLQDRIPTYESYRARASAEDQEGRTGPDRAHVQKVTHLL